MSDLVRLRIDLSYDGTNFAGWAIQPGQRSVQAELESAIAQILRLTDRPATVCAGRTDAGVHARGQVVHVDVPIASLGPVPEAQIATGKLQYSLNAVTPKDMAIRAVSNAPEGFDARHGALWRRYRYRVCDEPAQIDPWRRVDTLVYSRPLNVNLMNEAASVVLGEHDFAAFCKRREGATTIRTIEELTWQREGDSANLEMTIVADAFCRSMVRSLVGAFLTVGDGRQDARWLAEFLDAGVRTLGPNVVAPQGLVFDHVEYPPDAELADRAQLTRAKRSLAGNADDNCVGE